MSSYGVVLDLFDERYFNLQDVTGNVEPIPGLVPYEQYTQNMMVYRMEERHEFFVGRLHEFTDRIARLSGKELWTWFVQWEVETRSESSAEPATKKARLAASPGAPCNAPASSPQKGPAYTICERRTLRAELFEDCDMQRILIDIVQVDSKLLPNYVEFLYQWIDFFEGDGKALKAAMRMEIPSLWMFEFHPLPIHGNSSGEAAEAIGDNLTRKKPDISALEAMTEESERLQYREPRFGLQPPLDPRDEPLPPLINVPKDEDKRNEYYAACFKNRQRAFWLLQEAGLSARQIANYKKLQKEQPKDTPEDVNGTGFLNYYKEEPFAHEQFMLAEQMQKIRQKQNEIAISNKLALEAQLAAATQADAMLTRGSSDRQALPPPLIPPTPIYPGRANATLTILQRLEAIKQRSERAVDRLPPPILAVAKSRLFERTAATWPADPFTTHPCNLRYWPWSAVTDSDTSSETGDISSGEYSDSESYSGDDVDPDERDDDNDDNDDNDTDDMGGNVNSGRQEGTNAENASMNQGDENGMDYNLYADNENHVNHGQDSEALPNIKRRAQPALGTLPAPDSLVQQSESTTSNVPAFLQGLSHTQFGNIMPLFSHQAQQTILQRFTAPNLVPHAAATNLASNTNTNSQTPPNVLGAVAPSGLSAGPTVAPVLATRTSFVPGNTLHPLTTMNSEGQQMRTSNHPQQPVTFQIQGSGTHPAAAPGNYQGNSAFVQGQETGSAVDNYATSLPGGPQNISSSLWQGPGLGAPSLRTSSVYSSSASGTRAPLPVSYPGVLSSPQAVRSSLGLPQAAGAFPPPLRQPLTQSIVRAAPPSSLNLRSPDSNLDPRLPTTQHSNPSPGLMTPLANLTSSLTIANPYAASPHGIPIQIYVPKIHMRPDSAPNEATDCLVLGYTQPGSGVLKLCKALFLPVGVWQNTLRILRMGRFKVLESYAPPRTHPRFAARSGTLTNPEQLRSPHKLLHDRLGVIYGLMANCMDREKELTKRWRASPGPLTETKRGAVWEGYGVYVDQGIEMGREERKGAFVLASVDGPMDADMDDHARMRKKEIEELLDEEMGDGSESGGDAMEE